MATTQTILLLEDDDFDAAITRELLEKCIDPPYAVKHCKFLIEARTELARGDYAAALIDMNVPDSTGLETVRDIIRTSPTTPIIVLTGTDDNETAVAALRAGAQDYLPKNALNSCSIERGIHYAINRKQKENDLTAKAYYDSLTGLGNRALLYDRWRRALARSKRAERNVGVLVDDIDDFKQINNPHGHEAGDHLLMHLTDRLMACVRETDIVARLGGDEFVLVLENIRSKEEVNDVRDKLMSETTYALSQGNKNIPYSISIGGTLVDPDKEEDLMQAMREADTEMHRFKAARRSANEGPEISRQILRASSG